MVGVASVDVLPGGLHAVNFFFVGKFGEDNFFEFFGDGAGKNARNVHVGIAGAGEAEIDNANNLVVLV